MTLSVTTRTRLSPIFTLDLHLEVQPGVTIVFGASGSGKTTLLRNVAGLHVPDAGRISVGDRVLDDHAAGIHVPVPGRSIGYVFQHLALFPHMSVRDNIAYGLAHRGRAEAAARVDAIAQAFHIGHALDRRPGQISGGERQRTALARSLVTDPSALLLDEPLSALDYVTQSRIMDDLRTWNAAHGIPILYVTHAHREVFALGDRVVVLDGGRIVADGTPRDVMDSPTREAVAQLAGFENFLDATVVGIRRDAGTMECRPAGATIEIEAPLAPVTEGTKIRLAIRAGDILVATEVPRAISARNIIPGVIRSERQEGTTVRLMVDVGVPLEAHVTPAAALSLGLAPGVPVWLVIKTHSCHIVAS